MIIINKVVGNLSNIDPKHINYERDIVKLDPWESNKSRIRKTSKLGQEIAISLDRGDHLHNQDILFIDDENSRLIIVDIKLKNVLKITLSDDIHNETLFKLGHALGNQHWPAILKNNCVYVPLYVDEKIMRSMLKTHNFNEIDVEFIEGDALAHLLEASEFRLLFSGDDTTAHKHN